MIIKTNDFESDVRSGYYQQERNEAFKTRGTLFEVKTTFDEDFEKFLVDNGVPQKHVKKVATKAYQDGHAYGETEILNVSYDLIDIFAVPYDLIDIFS